jgi:hypothetical protein
VDNLPKTVDKLSELGKTRSIILPSNKPISLYMGGWHYLSPYNSNHLWVCRNTFSPDNFSTDLLGRNKSLHPPYMSCSTLIDQISLVLSSQPQLSPHIPSPY